MKKTLLVIVCTATIVLNGATLKEIKQTINEYLETEQEYAALSELRAKEQEEYFRRALPVRERLYQKEAEILELGSSYMLVFRKDILDDPYYYDQYYFSISKNLKAPDFLNEFNTFAEDLVLVEHKYATRYLNAKKFKYPSQ